MQFSECEPFKKRHRVEGESSETEVIDVTQGFGLLWLRCISEVLKVLKLYLWLRFFRNKIHRREGQSRSLFSGLVWRRDGDAVLVAETQPVCIELLWKHVRGAEMSSIQQGLSHFYKRYFWRESTFRSISRLIKMFNFKLTIPTNNCSTQHFYCLEQAITRSLFLTATISLVAIF